MRQLSSAQRGTGAVAAATSATAVAIVLGAALVAWVVVVVRMHGMMIEPGAVPGGFGFFLGLWVTMMAAMTLPAAAPTVLIVARLAAPGRSAPILFVTGYLLLWTGYGLLAYWLVRLLPGFSHQELAAGAAIVAAGLYQLTPLKRRAASLAAGRRSASSSIAGGAEHTARSRSVSSTGSSAWAAARG